tara:strand:+ start:268 stop:438 length:171 start_codon:yes stop_codon:yes gene_type:complete
MNLDACGLSEIPESQQKKGKNVYHFTQALIRQGTTNHRGDLSEKTGGISSGLWSVS